VPAGGKTERYTAVFTGLLTLRNPGEYPYLRMTGDGRGARYRGRPPYGELGGEISFEDLPEGCRRLVLDVYRELWGETSP
jgi:hypothetical protein